MYTAKGIIKKLQQENKFNILNLLKEYKLTFKKNSKYQVWQEGSHPELVNTEYIFKQKLEYIHNNPIKKGVASEPENWKYSSAGYYFLGESGVIDIDDPFK